MGQTMLRWHIRGRTDFTGRDTQWGMAHEVRSGLLKEKSEVQRHAARRSPPSDRWPIVGPIWLRKRRKIGQTVRVFSARPRDSREVLIPMVRLVPWRAEAWTDCDIRGGATAGTIAGMTSPRVDSVRLNVPGPGRTIGSVAEPIGTVLRTIANMAAAEMTPAGVDAYARLYLPRDSGLALDRGDYPLRAAWALVGAWCAVRVRDREPNVLALEDAEAVFWHGAREVGISPHLAGTTRRDIEQRLAGIDACALDELLPYVLDQHDPGTRRSVMKRPREARSRSARRANGIYYTPADVAEFMVGWLLDGRIANSAPLLDPACGSGVFLLAAAQVLSATQDSVDTLRRLYGIDRDPIALDAACFVLAANLGQRDTNTCLWRLWHLARLNLAQRDTLGLRVASGGLWESPVGRSVAEGRAELRVQLQGYDASLPEPRLLGEERETFFDLFPEQTGSWDVVGNPPYAPLGDRPDLASMSQAYLSLAGSRVTPATNAFIPFMELMWAIAGEDNRAALVVPMSIAYNTSRSFRSLRRAIASAGGSWTFRFFDRTPDALFGDDVKQRAAIVLRGAECGSPAFQTSALTRWTSRQRSQLFASLKAPVELSGLDIAAGIPKIGTQWELRAWKQIRRDLRPLTSIPARRVHSPSNPETDVVVGATAYNYFAVYRGSDESAEWVAGTILSMNTPSEAYGMYAYLSSNFVYWLWRVEGDGFHVPASWVLSLPMPASMGLLSELAPLGRRLWELARATPVYANNGGRRTVSYRPDVAVINHIDRVIASAFELDDEAPDRLARHRADTIVVGRTEAA